MSRRKLSFLILAWSVAIGLAISAWWFVLNGIPNRSLSEARSAYRRGQFALAARLAESQALSSQGSNGHAMLLAARSFARLGDWPRAEAYFAQVPLNERDDFHQRARGLEARGLWIEAAAVHEQILHRWPDDGEALQHLVAIRSQQDRDDEALVFARRLCYIPSYELSGNVMAGFLEHQKGNYSRAAEHFLTAVRMSPDLRGIPNEPSVIFQCLAEDLLWMGNGEEAERYASRAKELSTSADPCWHLGRAKQLRGDLGGAELAWEEAVARNPEYVPALQDLAQLNLQRGEIQLAIRRLETASEVEPANDAIRYMLSTARRYVQPSAESDDP